MLSAARRLRHTRSCCRMRIWRTLDAIWAWLGTASVIFSCRHSRQNISSPGESGDELQNVLNRLFYDLHVNPLHAAYQNMSTFNQASCLHAYKLWVEAIFHL